MVTEGQAEATTTKNNWLLQQLKPIASRPVPANRMKMRRPHEIILSRQVLGYLNELLALTGPDGFVFPAFHTSLRPMSENTMNQTFRRMGYTLEEITSHGLRTTASTLLNESGQWSPDAIERSLAHADSNSIRGIYNRGRYWDERVAMHQWWSDHLDQRLCHGPADHRQGGNRFSIDYNVFFLLIAQPVLPAVHDTGAALS